MTEDLRKARLIAAAPDLLAAAKEVHRIYVAGVVGTSFTPSDWFNALRALERAVEKAEGNQTPAGS